MPFAKRTLAGCPHAKLFGVTGEYRKRDVILDVPEPTPCSVMTAVRFLSEFGGKIQEFPCDYVVLSHAGESFYKLSPDTLRQMHNAYESGDSETAIRLFVLGLRSPSGSILVSEGEPEIVIQLAAGPAVSEWVKN